MRGISLLAEEQFASEGLRSIELISNEISLEANSEKTRYMFMSRQQNVG
jgi:hypothetical protein